MADYIYLLQTRLTPAQQTALQHVRDAAKARAYNVFLVGGAVRDLTSGAPIRDLDLVVQGETAPLRKDLEAAGGAFLGEMTPTHSLFFHFPGGVRLEVGSTLSATFPKPGKPVYETASILDDLRRRDFTANAMAISLNEGSYGLLMDPLNGVADIENRELRLASNYGFIEDPVRMIRGARLAARFGWHMEEKTQARYETGKAEGYISTLGAGQRGYETEELFHEEDPLRVLRRLEAEGWSKALFPAFSSAKVNEAELDRLRDLAGQLGQMGIYPNTSPAVFPLLTAKLPPNDLAALNKSFPLQGFVRQVAELDAQAKEFGAQFSGKGAVAPSQAWKLLFSAPPESVLWLAYSSKSPAVQAKFKAFFQEWPQARQRIPYQMMQEMRITPELPGYAALLEDLFFALMDGKLASPEATKAFLEPFSPPAPPPPVNLRRRVAKRETKAPKSRSKKAEPVPVEVSETADTPEGQLTVEATIAPVVKAPAKTAAKSAEISTPAKPASSPAPGASKPERASKPATEGAEASKAAAPAKAAPKSPPVKAPAKAAAATAPAKQVQKASAKAATPAKKAAAKAVAVQPSPKKPSAPPLKATPSRSAASKAPFKAAAKTPAKAPAKVAAKPSAAAGKKSAPAAGRKPIPAKKAVPQKAATKTATKSAAKVSKKAVRR